MHDGFRTGTRTRARKGKGPNALANDCRASVVALDAEIEIAPTEAERKQLRRRRKLVRHVESWCRTRAGYTEPAK
jgi:hypothetical protein